MARKKYLSIYSFSDVHDRFGLLKFPKADLYICSGDATNMGTIGSFEIFNRVMGECLKQKLTKKVLFVPGNHDFGLQDEYGDSILALSNMEVLIDKTIELYGLKIHGSPWTPIFYNWAFMKREIDLGNKWNLIPDDVNILVTHGPPYSILDKIERFPFNVGSSTLKQKIDFLIEKNLILHQFGHIHESRGIKKIKNTTFMNASSIQYNPNPLSLSPYAGMGYLVKINLETKKIEKIDEIY